MQPYHPVHLDGAGFQPGDSLFVTIDSWQIASERYIDKFHWKWISAAREDFELGWRKS
jgi:hypothetical protein